MKVQHFYTNRDVESTIQKCSEKGLSLRVQMVFRERK